MEFKSYPNYKDSGVEWLGDVPEHWRISSLKRYGYFKGGAGFPHAYQGNTEENIPFFKVNSLSKDKRFLSSFSDFVGEETAKKLGAKIFPKNSIFFAKVGAALLLERIRTNQQPCCIDNNMMGFVIQNELSFDFAFYLMSLIDFKYLVNPGAVPSINESQISSFLISVPPISEQTQIANYLDTETTRIDNLIAKQEKLIELLEEQRKSIISHAVTKGLNPNAPMKDSGVEWLGEVPNHWKIGRLKNLLSINNGSDYKEFEVENSENSYPVYGSGGVFTYSSKYIYDQESVLLGRKGTINKPLYVTSPFWAVDTMFYSQVKQGVHGKYVYYQALGFPYDRYSSNTALPSMTQTDLLNLSVTIPLISEQIEITQFLDNENAKFDNLIGTQSQLIEKLKEYRSSIISHAVTGKIDVREFC